MNAMAVSDKMRMTPAAISALIAVLSQGDARWRPEGSGWSILEIINHMVDEEVDDFRTRLRLTLEDPSQLWPGINPEGWARQRDYNERDLSESIKRFESARAESLTWLESLRDPDWSRAHEHPKLGVIRAGDLLAAWCAHDALHLRQIAKRLYQLTQRDAGEYSTSYAGVWTA